MEPLLSFMGMDDGFRFHLLNTTQSQSPSVSA